MIAPCKVCGVTMHVRPKRTNLCKPCFHKAVDEMREYANKILAKKPKVFLPEANHNIPHDVDQSFREIKKELAVNRVCLKCDKAFVAEGKFNRICLSCSPREFKQPWEEDGF